MADHPEPALSARSQAAGDHPPWWRAPGVWLLGYALLLGGNHLLWVSLDGRPPAWDQAIHLEKALRCARLLGEGKWGEILTLSGYYPPLTHCAAGLFHKLLGPSSLVALGFIQAVLTLVIFTTYWIGRRMGSLSGGLGAAILVGSYTEVFLESRAFMLDLPLTALVGLTVLFLLGSEGFIHRGWSLAAGLIGGLGLLAKWTFPFFLVPVVFSVWIQARRRYESRKRIWHGLLALAVAGVVSLPWYIKHLLLPASLLKAAYAGGAAEGDPGMASVAAWGYYFLGMIYQLGPPFAGLLLLGLVLARAWRISGVGLLLTWFLSPLLLLTLLQNKDYRFTLPLLPAVALLSVAWLQRLRPRLATGAVLGILALAIAHGAYLGWGVPDPSWARGRMDRRLVFPSFPPVAVYWPIDEILEVVARDRPPGTAPSTLAVVPDHIYFSRSNFRYYTTLRGLPIRLVRAWSGPPLFVDYAVTKEGEQGPGFSTKRARAVMARIQERDPTLLPLLHPIGEFPLPDGSRATLYKIASSPVQGIPSSTLIARLREVVPRALAWGVREPQGLSLEVEPISEAETLVGHFHRFVIRAESALVGDFRRKPLAIQVRGVDLVLDDVRINPHSLVHRGEIELLGLSRLTVRDLSVGEAALEQVLGQAAPWARPLTVRILDGALHLTGRFRGVEVRGAVRLELFPQVNGRVAVWVVQVAVGGVPLPSSLTNLGLRFLNPVARFDEEPAQIRIAHLAVGDGLIHLFSP